MSRLCLVSRAMEREAGRVYLQAGRGLNWLRISGLLAPLLGMLGSLGDLQIALDIQAHECHCYADPGILWELILIPFCCSLPVALLGTWGSAFLRSWLDKLRLEMTLTCYRLGHVD
jgi:hypothetical protein